MLTVVQFPIADSRGFRTDPLGRLTVPDWPSPRTKVRRQFVRHFGPAEDRRQVADQAWADEHAYCRASRAIAFPQMPALIGSPSASFAPIVAFRRLFVDESGVVGRVEVGLSNNKRRPKLDQAGWLAALDQLLQLETRVPEEAPRIAPLLNQGPRLAQLFRRGSTTNGVQVPAADVRLVDAGDPLVIVVLEQGELIGELEGVRRVKPEEVAGADLAFGWVKPKTIDGQIGVWFVRRGTASGDALRLLRLCLLRLHAERECLDSVLRQIRRQAIRLDAGDEVAQRIQLYLNRATRLISKESWNGLSQSAILAAFDAAVSVGEPDETADLASRLEAARSQVTAKVLEYASERSAPKVVQQINVEGDQVNTTTNVTNVDRAQYDFNGDTVFINKPTGKVELQSQAGST